ncbi:MAG: hypothetical protein GXY83_24595 [Rhodopirellula sp.]|nr:hypothetical protein [Rhodopirellula sp.]
MFAVCEKFFSLLGEQYQAGSGDKRGAAAAVAKWLREERGRGDLGRERIYPLIWEAFRRNFLFLQPPRERDLADQIARRYGISRYAEDKQVLQVVDVSGEEAARNVTSAGADLVLSLIQRIAARRAGPVHVGLGAGYSAMRVAKRLAQRLSSDLKCPDLVLHALSAGGFRIDQPHKSPISYFGYFDDVMARVECVALYAETVVTKSDYQRVKRSLGVKKSFERADEIDIVITSLASEEDEHGMLGQFLASLIDEGELDRGALDEMRAAGWVGDVQFRPYSAATALADECPVRAVTLFEISELVERVKRNDRYVVLLAGPCAECGRTKTKALVPLLTQENLLLWTHLVTDVPTARELLS